MEGRPACWPQLDMSREGGEALAESVGTLSLLSGEVVLDGIAGGDTA